MAGDFAAVYDEEIWSVYGFVAYRVGSVGEAEELTQATFERALRSWGSFDPSRGSARTWLLAIARNLLIDHYRGRAGVVHQPLEATPEEELGTDPAEPDLGIDPDLAAALATLGQREREVLALRYGGELTGPEIADLTGLSLANVQQIASRALRTLRERLEGPAGPG